METIEVDNQLFRRMLFYIMALDVKIEDGVILNEGNGSLFEWKMIYQLADRMYWHDPLFEWKIL